MQAASLSEYLERYGEQMLRQVEEALEPLVTCYDRPEIELGREPYDTQWPRILATVAGWKAGRKGMVLSAEMGTGKTLVSMVAAHLHAGGKPYRALVMCPSHLQSKWCRELIATIPGANVKVINHYADVLRLIGKKPVGAEWYVMSSSKAKLATSWRPSFVKKKHRIGWLHCPDCGAEIKKKVVEDGADVLIAAQPEDLKKCQTNCKECSGALYQWNHDIDRWPVADVVQKQAKGVFKYFVADEAHEGKSATTAIGLAIGKLSRSIPYKVALTGTLLNGYADSVFPLSYRMFPKEMVDAGIKWGDTMVFIKRFGRIETIISFKDEQSYANRQSRGGGKKTTTRIRPGIVPSMYGECLMNNTVFCSLADLNRKLPKLEEFLHPVVMDPELQENYDQLEDEVRAHLRGMLAKGSKAAISVLLNTLNGWPDHPFDFGAIGYQGEESWVTVAEPPNLDRDVERNKEKELVEIVKDNHTRGRQVWVYCEMVGVRDVMLRLKASLEAEGLRVKILRSGTVDCKGREQWIYDNCKDVDIVLSNPALVRTGLDLFAPDGNHNFATLVFYQSGYMLDTLRQAAGRAHRIGQTLDCEVHYLFYVGTMQEQCVKLMSQKTNAARSVEGKFDSTTFTAMTEGDESVAMMLAKRLADKTGDMIAAKARKIRDAMERGRLDAQRFCSDQLAGVIATRVPTVQSTLAPDPAVKENSTRYRLTPARLMQWERQITAVVRTADADLKKARQLARAVMTCFLTLDNEDQTAIRSCLKWAELEKLNNWGEK